MINVMLYMMNTVQKKLLTGWDDEEKTLTDEEFEIVNPDDKFERSSKEANGKELADFITGQSNTIKKKLVQPRETKTAAHIVGCIWVKGKVWITWF